MFWLVVARGNECFGSWWLVVMNVLARGNECFGSWWLVVMNVLAGGGSW